MLRPTSRWPYGPAAKLARSGCSVCPSRAGMRWNAPTLQPAGEMVCVDRQPVAVIETVSVEALRAGAGVQVQLAASEAPALVNQPVQQRARMPLTTRPRRRREIVHIQVAPPRE